MKSLQGSTEAKTTRVRVVPGAHRVPLKVAQCCRARRSAGSCVAVPGVPGALGGLLQVNSDIARGGEQARVVECRGPPDGPVLLCTRAAPKNGSARLHRTQRRGEEQLRARGSARSSPTPWNSTVEEGEGAPRCAPNCTPSFQEPPLRGATRGGETTPRPKAPRLRRVTPRVHGEEDLAMDVQLNAAVLVSKGLQSPFRLCMPRAAGRPPAALQSFGQCQLRPTGLGQLGVHRRPRVHSQRQGK